MNPEDIQLQALADAERDWKIEKTKACRIAHTEWDYAEAQREREIEVEVATLKGKAMPSVVARRMKEEKKDNPTLVAAWVKYQNALTAKAEAECHYNDLERKYWKGRRPQ